jgi:hypothetical protein
MGTGVLGVRGDPISLSSSDWLPRLVTDPGLRVELLLPLLDSLVTSVQVGGVLSAGGSGLFSPGSLGSLDMRTRVGLVSLARRVSSCAFDSSCCYASEVLDA